MGGQELDDKRLNTMLKIGVIVCGIGLLGISLHIFSTFNIDSPVQFFLAIYYILFGVLLITSEMPIAWTTRHFSFLAYYIGRGVFMLFVGSLIFNTGVWWYILIACIIFLLAIIYIILGIGCRGRIKAVKEENNQQSQKSFRPAQQEEVRNIELPPSVPLASDPFTGNKVKVDRGSSLPPPLPDNIRPV